MIGGLFLGLLWQLFHEVFCIFDSRHKHVLFLLPIVLCFFLELFLELEKLCGLYPLEPVVEAAHIHGSGPISMEFG